MGPRFSQALPDGTRVTLQCWRADLRFTKWDRKFMGKTPLWQGTWLLQVVGLQGFAQWDKVGITHLEDVWRGSTLMSFQELREQYQLGPTQFYRYLQFRHTLLAHIPLHTPLLEFNPLKAKGLMGRKGRGATSRTYPSMIISATETFPPSAGGGRLRWGTWMKRIGCRPEWPPGSWPSQPDRGWFRPII